MTARYKMQCNKKKNRDLYELYVTPSKVQPIVQNQKVGNVIEVHVPFLDFQPYVCSKTYTHIHQQSKNRETEEKNNNFQYGSQEISAILLCDLLKNHYQCEK